MKSLRDTNHNLLGSLIAENFQQVRPMAGTPCQAIVSVSDWTILITVPQLDLSRSWLRVLLALRHWLGGRYEQAFVGGIDGEFWFWFVLGKRARISHYAPAGVRFAMKRRFIFDIPRALRSRGGTPL